MKINLLLNFAIFVQIFYLGTYFIRLTPTVFKFFVLYIICTYIAHGHITKAIYEKIPAVELSHSLG